MSSTSGLPWWISPFQGSNWLTQKIFLKLKINDLHPSGQYTFRFAAIPPGSQFQGIGLDCSTLCYLFPTEVDKLATSLTSSSIPCDTPLLETLGTPNSSKGDPNKSLKLPWHPCPDQGMDAWLSEHNVLILLSTSHAGDLGNA